MDYYLYIIREINRILIMITIDSMVSEGDFVDLPRPTTISYNIYYNYIINKARCKTFANLYLQELLRCDQSLFFLIDFLSCRWYSMNCKWPV